jgi:hypothetical protein
MQHDNICLATAPGAGPVPTLRVLDFGHSKGILDSLQARAPPAAGARVCYIYRDFVRSHRAPHRSAAAGRHRARRHRLLQVARGAAAARSAEHALTPRTARHRAAQNARARQQP